MALVKLFSIPKIAGEAGTSVLVVRTLADAGLIDSFKTERNHRACPPHAVKQVKQHLARAQEAADVE